MVDTPDSLDRVETAANIFVRLSYTDDSGSSKTIEVPISELDLTKDVDVERVREIGLYPDGYAVNAIDIDGSITFAGNVVRPPDGTEKDLDSLLFKSDGTPEVFDITVVHVDEEDPKNNTEDNGNTSTSTETVENAIIVSSEYSASSGETTESSYEFMGQRINN